MKERKNKLRNLKDVNKNQRWNHEKLLKFTENKEKLEQIKE